MIVVSSMGWIGSEIIGSSRTGGDGGSGKGRDGGSGKGREGGMMIILIHTLIHSHMHTLTHTYSHTCTHIHTHAHAHVVNTLKYIYNYNTHIKKYKALATILHMATLYYS